MTISKQSIELAYGLKLGEEQITFCGPTEIITVLDGNLVRMDLATKQIETTGSIFRKSKTPIDSSTDLDLNKVTCLLAPPDHLNYLLVGFADGHVEIRDTETLRYIFFETSVSYSAVTSFAFSLDLNYSLVFETENGAVFNIILARGTQRNLF